MNRIMIIGFSGCGKSTLARRLGEILDIDGDCGGFNLQNAWSTAFVCANAILNEKENQ